MAGKRDKRDKEKPVYMISVAAKLTGMHPQTLRIYERKELVSPGRTAKSTRLYSEGDIDRLKYIQQLTQDAGVNLAGVKIIMELQNKLDNIGKTIVAMEAEMVEAERRKDEEVKRAAKRHRYDLVLVPKARQLAHRIGRSGECK